MDELAEDEGLRKQFGSNALKRVAKEYTSEVMRKRYKKVFGELNENRI